MHVVTTTPPPPTDLTAELERWRTCIRAAHDTRQPVWVRGGGTKAFLDARPSPRGTVLDTRAYTGVVAYEPSELVVTARAGTPLAELEQVLAAQGQYLPFEPPHFGPGATVGGMVAAGLSGPARASVGSVRDFVLGASLLNGRGEHLTFGGQVMKNVAGYDVSRVLAGSMGTLGVITEVSLKVLPIAVAETTLRFNLAQAEAIAQLARWRGMPLPLNASCWVFDETGQPPQSVLYVRLRGARAAVEAACNQMLGQVPGTRLDGADTRSDWAACRDQRLPFFTPTSPDMALWRVSVAQTAPALQGLGPTLVEWHGGLRWIWAPPTAAERVREAAAQAGGHATLFRPPQADSTPELARHTPLAPAQQAVQQRLKHAFDPAGIFNPGIWGRGF